MVQMQLPRLVCVLLVGEQCEADAGLMIRLGVVGTWWLFAEVDEAWRWVDQLIEQDQMRRVLVDQSEIFYGLGTRWRGPAIERMRAVALGVPSGSVVMSDWMYKAWRAHGCLSGDVTLLDQEGATSWWMMPMTAETFWEDTLAWRTNIQHRNTLCLGREDVLSALDRSVHDVRVVGLHGVAGVGKTLVVQKWLEHLLLDHRHAHVWWLSLVGLRAIEDIASPLAQLCGAQLSGETTQWVSMLARRLAAAGRHTWLVLDDADQLDPQTIEWLSELIRQSGPLRWVITSRRKVNWPDGQTHELNPLDLMSTVQLLDVRSNTLNAMPLDEQRLQALLRWGQLCQGHALSIDVVARAMVPNDDHEDALVQIGEHADVMDAHLYVAWHRLKPMEQRALCILGSFERIFAQDDAVDLITHTLSCSQERAAHIFQVLTSRAWLQSMPTASRWWLPTLVKTFVKHHDVSTQDDAACFANWIEARIMSWFELLDTSEEYHILRVVAMYEQDIKALMARHFEAKDERGIALLVAMRRYFQKARFSALYDRLLTQALMSVWPDHAALLACQLLVHDRQPVDQEAHHKRFEAIWSRRETLPVELRMDIAVNWSLILDDFTYEHLDRGQRFGIMTALYEEATELGLPVYASRAASLLAQFHALTDATESLRWAEKAQHLAQTHNIPTLVARSAFALHRAYMGAGRFYDGEGMARCALDAASKMNYPEFKVMLIASLGSALLSQGKLKHALRQFHTALSLSQQYDFAFGASNCAYLLATAYVGDAQYDTARNLLDEAMAFYKAQESSYNINITRMWLAVASVGLGQLNHGRTLFEEAEVFFLQNDVEEFRPHLKLLGLVPAIYQAAWVDRDTAALKALEVEHQTLTTPMLVHESMVVSRFIDRAHVVIQRQSNQTLEVVEDLTMFLPPSSQEWVNIRRRKAMQLIFKALVEHRQSAPGEVLSAQALFDAGWPGEHLARSGMMRLYVAINTLRKMGLEDVLETAGDGYRIHPNVDVRVGVPS